MAGGGLKGAAAGLAAEESASLDDPGAEPP
jgi:hypothetical protein